MRLAIITPYGMENYGNRLQNYALQKVLENDGHKVETLVVEKRAKGRINELRRNFVVDNGKGFRFVRKAERMKKRAFQNFTNKYIHCRIERYADNLIPETINNEYDAFIVGSDQVWNPFYWGKADASYYLLSFADKDKRIAYAASFGLEEIPVQFENIFEEELSKFSNISVREKGGTEIIKKICNKDVAAVLDPTLLIDRNEWRKLELNYSVDTSKEYIVKLFLGEQDEDTVNYIDKFAKEFGYEIFELQNIQERRLFQCGPEEFLCFIDHAQAVFTDSFHTAVFSIIFHTPFVTFERSHKNGQNIVNRIDSLLQLFGFSDRKGRIDYTNIKACDFGIVDRILEEERKKSLEYLKKALDKVESYNK